MANKIFDNVDGVESHSIGGHCAGKAVKKVTEPPQVKGCKVAASNDNSEYIVKSNKSGAGAAHKPESLKPR